MRILLLYIIISAKLSGIITQSTIPLLNDLSTVSLEKYPQTYQDKVQLALQNSSNRIRIVSYNILFNIFDERIKNPEHLWENRLPKLIEIIENINPDILCVQELYPKQLEDIYESIGDRFSFFAGECLTGELNGIFYKKDRFNIDQTSHSLQMPMNSKDDEKIQSISNYLPEELEPGRMLTLAHFEDNLTGKSFSVINTHLSFFRINSRQDQAYFIKNLVKNLHAEDRSIILTGDFNTFPNRPGIRTLPFYDGDLICQILQEELKDTKDAALLGHFGPQTTAFHNFFNRKNKPFTAEEDSDIILDHIFVSDTITTLIHATEPSQVEGQFPSDHMPIIADILI